MVRSNAATASAQDGGSTIVVAERWSEVEALAPVWKKLLGQTPLASAFLTWEWSQSWWEAFGQGSTPWIITVRGAGRVAGLVPLRLHRERVGLRRACFLADGTGDSDGLDVVAGPGEEAQVVEAAAEWLDGHRRRWDVLQLNTVPAESPSIALWEHAAKRRGWRLDRSESAHLVIPLPATWQEFLARLSPKMREAIPYRRRFLEKHFRDVAIRRCASQDEVPEFLAELFRLHRLRWERSGQSGAFFGRRKDFYRRLAPRFLANGWLDLRLLEADGKAIAAYFGFRHGRTYSYLQSGFDPAYARYSPGWVLGETILQETIAERLAEFDFLGGDEIYKRRWGAEERRYVSLTMARPGVSAALLHKLDKASRQAKEIARKMTPSPVWKAARAAVRGLRSDEDE